MVFRPPRHVITPEVEAAEAQLQQLQNMLMNQQAELGAKRADVQVCCPTHCPSSSPHSCGEKEDIPHYSCGACDHRQL